MSRQQGAVAALWRYPVKSMAGERLDAVTVTGRGLWVDRAYALVDRADGKVATAKNPRKWPRLFEFAATLSGGAGAEEPGVELPPVLIRTPEGLQVSSAESRAGEVLRRALGRDVDLRAVEPVAPASGGSWRATSEEYQPHPLAADGGTVSDFEMPEGTFFDSAVVHLLTNATLSRLAELHPEGRMEPRRFRPNVVVDCGAERRFVEDDWVGRTLRLGDQVRLTVTGQCARCVMVTLAQGDLPKDTGILRAVAQHNGVHAGVYAAVVSGGRLRAGDPVILE